MGLSSLAEDCAHYRQALNQARQALEVAQNLRPATGLCDFSELGVLRLLQGIVDRSLIDDFVGQTLGPLITPGRKTRIRWCTPSTRCSRKTAMA